MFGFRNRDGRRIQWLRRAWMGFGVRGWASACVDGLRLEWMGFGVRAGVGRRRLAIFLNVPIMDAHRTRRLRYQRWLSKRRNSLGSASIHRRCCIPQPRVTKRTLGPAGNGWALLGKPAVAPVSVHKNSSRVTRSLPHQYVASLDRLAGWYQGNGEHSTISNPRASCRVHVVLGSDGCS